MASIIREIDLPAPADVVWDAVRDFGAVHTRLAPGFFVGTRLEDEARLVTFASGAVVREVLVGWDDQRRRLSYAAVGGRSKHHNASMQVEPGRDGGSRLIWTTDVLPDEIAPYIAQNVEIGAKAMQAHFADG